MSKATTASRSPNSAKKKAASARPCQHTHKHLPRWKSSAACARTPWEQVDYGARVARGFFFGLDSAHQSSLRALAWEAARWALLSFPPARRTSFTHATFWRRQRVAVVASQTRSMICAPRGVTFANKSSPAIPSVASTPPD